MKGFQLASLFFVLYVHFAYCQSDLEIFERFLPGVFDNEEEIECTGRPLTDRIHSTVIRINLPALEPASTFYIEQYSGNDPNAIYRQRIYAAEEDGNGNIPMKIYKLNDEERFRYGYYSPYMFESLTLDDLEYTTGCDVIWSLRSDGVFDSQMLQNECYIAGGAVRLEDVNELSPSFLTVAYKMYDAETEILLSETSYNMSRMEPRTSAKSAFDVYDSLLQGKEVRFDIDVLSCSPEGARNTSYSTYGSDANSNFKLINFTGVATPYVVFSSQKDFRHLVTGDIYQRYGQVALYLDDSARVRLRLIEWNEASKEVLASDTLWCDTEWTSGNEEAQVKFFISDAAGKIQLGHYNDLYRALQEGVEVFHVVKYLGCDLDDGTPSNSPVIMGGKISNYDMTDGILMFSLDDMISNQQDGIEDPFVNNVRYFQVSPSGHVTYQIGNYDLEGQETLISIRHCKMNGQHGTGTAWFFTAAKMKTFVCNS